MTSKQISKNSSGPRPKSAQLPEASIFSYPLPDQWGVDKNIIPNAGLSDKVAVLTLSTTQTDRLLKEMPLKVGGVLAKTDRPLAAAGWFDWTELIEHCHALDQLRAGPDARARNGRPKGIDHRSGSHRVGSALDDQEHYQRNLCRKQHSRTPTRCWKFTI